MTQHKKIYLFIISLVIVILLIGSAIWCIRPYMLKKQELKRAQNALQMIESINEAIRDATVRYPGKEITPKMLELDSFAWEDDFFVYSMNNFLVFACRKQTGYSCDITHDKKSQIQNIHMATGASLLESLNCVNSKGRSCLFGTKVFRHPSKRFGSHGVYSLISSPQGIRIVCEDEYNFICERLVTDK